MSFPDVGVIYVYLGEILQLLKRKRMKVSCLDATRSIGMTFVEFPNSILSMFTVLFRLPCAFRVWPAFPLYQIVQLSSDELAVLYPLNLIFRAIGEDLRGRSFRLGSTKSVRMMLPKENHIEDIVDLPSPRKL